MNKDGLASAINELRRAKAELQGLDPSKNLEAVKDSWSAFLVHFNRVFTKLEQASKDGSSKGWFDKVKNERKNSPHLSYMLHARNVDEHGLAAIYEDAPPDVRIGAPGEAFYIEELRVANGKVEKLSFGDSAPPSVSERSLRVELVTVKDRGVDYAPPVNDNSAFKDCIGPRELANIGVEFAERIIAEAHQQQ